MKQVRVVLVIISLFFISFMAFRPKEVPLKTYSVSLSQDQWVARLRFISDAKEVMRKSSYPGTAISQVSDSLDILSKEINEQVGSEIQREATKSQTDTTHKPVTNKH